MHPDSAWIEHKVIGHFTPESKLNVPIHSDHIRSKLIVPIHSDHFGSKLIALGTPNLRAEAATRAAQQSSRLTWLLTGVDESDMGVDRR